MQSCFNYVNLLEAESLGNGNNMLQLEGEFDYIPSSTDNDGYWGSIEFLYARGITDKYDLGLYVNTNASIGLHNKYNVLDTDLNDLAIGLDAKFIVLSPLNTWELFPTLYYSRNLGKMKLIVNPTVKIGNDFSTEGNVYAAPSMTIGLKSNAIPLSIGYTATYIPLEFQSLFHGLGLSYTLEF